MSVSEPVRDYMRLYMRAYRAAGRDITRMVRPPGVKKAMPRPPRAPRPADFEERGFIDLRPGHCWRCSDSVRGEVCGLCVHEIEREVSAAA